MALQMLVSLRGALKQLDRVRKEGQHANEGVLILFVG